MVKHSQTIRRRQLTNSLSVLDHFVVLVLKGLNCEESIFSLIDIYVRFYSNLAEDNS